MISEERRTIGKAVLGGVALVVMLILVAAPAGRCDDRVPFPKPASHQGNWVYSHGLSAQVQRSEPSQEASSCLVCHTKNDCISCHSTRMPKDHTNYWRTTGHGMTASVNRERCQICHRQDYCIRCHNETAPRSHMGNWTKRHCQWCHFASGIVPGDNCGVCHKAAPHTSRPAGHVPIGPQTNCAACHF